MSSPAKPSPSLNEAAQALSNLALSTSCPAPYTAIKTKDKIAKTSSIGRMAVSKQLTPSVATIFSDASSEKSFDSLPYQKSVCKLYDDKSFKQLPPESIHENPSQPVITSHRPPLLPQPVKQGDPIAQIILRYGLLL